MPHDDVPPSAEDLTQQLAALTAERDAARADLARLSAERDQARTGSAEAVAAYRHAVVAGLPEPARALVAGDSVQAIDAAAATARRLVEEITAAARAGSVAAPVPNGGATRQPPDLSTLTAAEKIRYGIEYGGSRQ